MCTAMGFGKGMYNLNSVEFTANIKCRPRFIKTHLPFSLLPDQIRSGRKKPKVNTYILNIPSSTL